MPPVINKDRCKCCGSCVDACPSDVFYGSAIGDVPLVTYKDECWHCNACVEACPYDGSIKLRIPLPLMILYQDKAL